MKTPVTSQKLRGGYYTPEAIAQFLAEWAIDKPTLTVLEPSCGDGNIVEAVAKTLLKQGVDEEKMPDLVFGVEIDEEEARKCLLRLSYFGLSSNNVVKNDFFSYCREMLLEGRKFDVVLGNPPFIRYQHFQEEHRSIAFQIMQHAGLKPTRLTNAWVPFVVASTLLLKDHGGRIGMIIPAEILQVNYAAELRRFLSDHYSKITIFTFKKLVFSGIQQEVVLLLGEKNGNSHTGIRVIEVDDIEDLTRHKHSEFSNEELRNMDHSRDKWTQYFLSQKEIDFLRVLRTEAGFIMSGKMMNVDVGVVTGLNDFFVLPENTVVERNLSHFVKPIVTRSGHLRGVQFAEEDFSQNKMQQLPCWLLNVPPVEFQDLPKSVQAYITFGESMGYNTGYKCRIRNKWYTVPSVWVPDAFMLRQIHNHPKLILNKTKATSTDTIHRVRFLNKQDACLLTIAFINSLTFAFTEITGRSYGGGVLELEPNEAEFIPMPVKGGENLDVDVINRLMVDGKIQDSLDIVDKVMLIDGHGLAKDEVLALREIWSKLRDRRINRKHSKSTRKQTNGK